MPKRPFSFNPGEPTGHGDRLEQEHILQQQSQEEEPLDAILLEGAADLAPGTDENAADWQAPYPRLPLYYATLANFRGTPVQTIGYGLSLGTFVPPRLQKPFKPETTSYGDWSDHGKILAIGVTMTNRQHVNERQYLFTSEERVHHKDTVLFFGDIALTLANAAHTRDKARARAIQEHTKTELHDAGLTAQAKRIKLPIAGPRRRVAAYEHGELAVGAGLQVTLAAARVLAENEAVTIGAWAGQGVLGYFMIQGYRALANPEERRSVYNHAVVTVIRGIEHTYVDPYKSA